MANFFDQFDAVPEQAAPGTESGMGFNTYDFVTQPQAARPPAGARDDSGGQFAAPLPDGQNFRVAREGVSPPAPLGFGDRLANLWNNPRPGGLVYPIRRVLEAARTLGEGGAGNIPMTDENGRINPDMIEAAADVASLVPLRMAPGGIAARPIGGGLAKVAAPTIDELRNAASAGPRSAEVTGFTIAPSAAGDFARKTRQALTDEGSGRSVAEGVSNILGDLEKAPPGGVVTGSNLESVRKTLLNAAREVDGNGKPTPNADAARMAIDALDAFVPGIARKDIIAGDQPAAAQALESARGNESAATAAAMVDRKTVQAELRATNPGQNIADAIKQRVAAVLVDPAQLAKYTPAERALMEQVAGGTATSRTMRFVGDLLGGDGGQKMYASAIAGGLAAGTPVAAPVLPAIGYTLNLLGNQMTLREAARLSEAIRARSPLADAMKDFGEKAARLDAAPSRNAMLAVALAARGLSIDLRDSGFDISSMDLMRASRPPAKGRAEDNQ